MSGLFDDDRQTARQIEAIAQAGVHEDQCNCRNYDALTGEGCVFGFRANASISVQTYLDILAEMIDRHHIRDEDGHSGFDGDGRMGWPAKDRAGTEFGSIADWMRA